MRVGLGYDLHAFAEGRELVLGGVRVPHVRGLDGHSDADVLTHALVDAILGAAALGTIGEHFPDSDPKFAGVSSLELLSESVRMVRKAGWRVVNVDAVITAQEPRLQPHLRPMAEALAACLGIEASQVGVKATSPEGLGALGRREGVSAQAVALIKAHPGDFAELTLRRALYMWTNFWSFSRRYREAEPLDPPNIFLCTALTVLALEGLRRALQRGASIGMPYAIALFFFPMVYYVTHPQDYYRRPIDPIFVVLAAYAITSWMQDRARPALSQLQTHPS